MAARQQDLVSFEDWDTNFREGVKAAMWGRADSVVGVRHVTETVCAVYLANGKEIQPHADAAAFVELRSAGN